jgi:AMP phosphorylase
LRLRAKLLGLESGGKSVVILNKDDAEDMGVLALGRVRVGLGGRELTAIVNTTTALIGSGSIGICEEVRRALGASEGDELEVEPTPPPRSLHSIRNKLRGRKLAYGELLEIVRDVVEGNLSDIEIAAFVTALHAFGLDLDEATGLSMAMVATGNTLDLDRPLIVDKHSIGGVPGDKTTLLVVPIIAACGLTIPKSSSRAITSAAGTADRAEALMPVDLGIEEMRGVVERTNGCIVWGGSLHLAPADDLFIRVEHPLSIDPLLLPSIMSKKKAVGAKLLVVDIPCGRGAKVKTIGEADLLANDFMELGGRLGIQVRCAVTYGEQPIGYAIGPALEAREALGALMGRSAPPDLLDKAVDIAGILLDMAGRGDGRALALEALRSGRAEEKMREIIEAQGGDPEVGPEDIAIGDRRFEIRSERAGYVLWIDNASMAELARLAGCPRDKGAGILLHKKVGDRVEEGEPLFTIYAERGPKLQQAVEALEGMRAIGVGERMEMLIHEVKERALARRAVPLDR